MRSLARSLAHPRGVSWVLAHSPVEIRTAKTRAAVIKMLIFTGVLDDNVGERGERVRDVLHAL